MFVGVPANATTSRGVVRMGQEKTLAQHNLVSQCWVRLLDSDPEQWTFDIFKYSMTLGESFPMTVITKNLKAFIQTPLQSTCLLQGTCDFFHKNGFY